MASYQPPQQNSRRVDLRVSVASFDSSWIVTELAKATNQNVFSDTLSSVVSDTRHSPVPESEHSAEQVMMPLEISDLNSYMDYPPLKSGFQLTMAEADSPWPYLHMSLLNVTLPQVANIPFSTLHHSLLHQLKRSRLMRLLPLLSLMMLFHDKHILPRTCRSEYWHGRRSSRC
jgi:hypothetical protein